MKYPFEASPEEIDANPDVFVAVVFSTLESEFLVLPKGEGFVEYPVFEHAYEQLKRATNGFQVLDAEVIINSVLATPLVLIVLRSMMGFTPPEWAYIATQRTGVIVNQGFVRSLDRRARISPGSPLRPKGEVRERVGALVHTACQLLSTPAPKTNADRLHRMDKADTRDGWTASRTSSIWELHTRCSCTNGSSVGLSPGTVTPCRS